MNAIAKPASKTDREWNVLWAIRDAQEKAYMEGDGEPQAIHLIAALAKHGLVIVEASKWGSAKAALMVIGSCGAPDGRPAITALELAADVARRELKKMAE